MFSILWAPTTREFQSFVVASTHPVTQTMDASDTAKTLGLRSAKAVGQMKFKIAKQLLTTLIDMLTILESADLLLMLPVGGVQTLVTSRLFQRQILPPRGLLGYQC